MCSHLQSLHFISSDSKRYFSGIQTERINCSKEMAFHLSEHLVFTSNVRWAFNTAVTLWLINLLTSCPTSSKMGIPKAFYMSIFRSFFAQLQQVFKTLPFFSVWFHGNNFLFVLNHFKLCEKTCTSVWDFLMMKGAFIEYYDYDSEFKDY